MFGWRCFLLFLSESVSMMVHILATFSNRSDLHNESNKGDDMLKNLLSGRRPYMGVPDLVAMSKKRSLNFGSDLVGGTPAEFDAFLAADMAKWGKLVNDVGLKKE